MRKYIANIITSTRILFSITLIFFSPLSAQFIILYLFCGFSDMLDGTIARKINGVSKFGAKLDTASDLIFVVVSLFKFLPIMGLPMWLMIWVTVIAIIKISNIAWGFIREKQFMSLHTIMNKITGFLLFLLPLTLPFVGPIYSLAVVCFVATLSALQEGYYIGTKREVL